MSRGPTLLGLCLLATALAAPGRAAESCTPWPGEFSPLPTVADTDPFRARWARTRADQLLLLSLRLEVEDRFEANRLWQRALCLDPNNEVARAGIERTRPPVVVENAAQAAAELRQAPAPIRIATPAAAPAVATLDASLARAEQMIRAARFDEALALLRGVRPRIAKAGVTESVTRRRVRLETLSATAHLAFGDEAAARESLERALRASPALELDLHTTPPKLLRALDAARGELGATPAVSKRADVAPASSDPVLP